MAGFWDDLSDGWNKFIGMTPNAAGDARAAMAPTADSMRSPNGRYDASAIGGQLGLSGEDLEKNSDNLKVQAAIGNMRQQLIDGYKAPERSGMDWLSDVMRAASVPIASYQGNSSYANSMQAQLSKEGDTRRGYADKRKDLTLKNSDDMLTGIGTDTLGYLSKKRDEEAKIEAQINDELITAAKRASMPGSKVDPAAAQQAILSAYYGQLRAKGYGRLADKLKKAYPDVPVATAPTPPQAPAGAPAVPGPDTPMSGGAPITTGALPDQGPPGFLGQLQRNPHGLGDAAVPGAGMAAAPPGAPAAALGGQPPVNPGAAPPPQVPPHVAQALDEYHKYIDLADQARVRGLDDDAKAYEERAKSALGAIKTEKLTGADGNEQLVRVDQADAVGEPRVLHPQGGVTANEAQFGDYALHGDDFLASIPDGAFKNDVLATLEGRKLPTPPWSKNKVGQQVNRAVEAADGDFNFFDAGARKKYVEDFGASAPSSKGNVRPLLGTFANHLTSVLEKAKALDNGPLPAFNAAKNEFENQTGSGKIAGFNTELHGLQKEIGKYLNAGVVTVQETEDLKSQISAAKSPAQLRAALDGWQELVMGKVKAMDDNGRMVMGQRGWRPEKYSMMTPEAKKVLEKYDQDKWGRIAIANSREEAAAQPPDVPFTYKGNTVVRHADGTFDTVDK